APGRPPPPQGKGPFESLSRQDGVTASERPPSVGDQPVEPEGVHPPERRLEDVAAVPALQTGRPAPVRSGRLERPPQPGHEALERHPDAGRRRLAPQLIDQDVDRDDTVQPDQERGEQRPLLGAADLDDPIAGDHFDGAEQPELDAVTLPRVHASSRPPSLERTASARGGRPWAERP